VESATAPPATAPSCGQQPLRRPGGPSRSSRQRAAEAILRRVADPTIARIASLVLMSAVLLVRPQGLFKGYVK